MAITGVKDSWDVRVALVAAATMTDVTAGMVAVNGGGEFAYDGGGFADDGGNFVKDYAICRDDDG